MKNRKPTKYAGIFSYESKGMKLYGLKFSHKGTQVQKQGYTSLATARQARAEISTAIETGEYFKKEYTLDEYFEIYANLKVKSGKWNKSSERTYTTTYKMISIDLKKKKLEEISRQDIQMLNIKLGEQYRSTTISCVLGLLSSILEHAYQNEVLSRNRAKGIEPVKSNKPKFNKELSLEDFNVVKKYIHDHYDIMVQVAFMLLSYGLRRGEVLAIRESSVEFKDNVTKIHIDKSRTVLYPDGKGTKTGKERDIFITQEDTVLLKKAIKLSKERYVANKKTSYTKDAWLLVEKNGEPFIIQLLNNVFKHIKKKTGINITPHILRHFFATQAQSTNINPRLIANFLGHANISMTDKYTHATDDGGILVMEKVNQKIN
jgi:phage integrase family site-specific recombinase